MAIWRQRRLVDDLDQNICRSNGDGAYLRHGQRRAVLSLARLWILPEEVRRHVGKELVLAPSPARVDRQLGDLDSGRGHDLRPADRATVAGAESDSVLLGFDSDVLYR